MNTKTITSNIEVPEKTWNSLEEKIESIDPVRRSSDKHNVEQALILADHLLEEQFDNINMEIQKAKREIQELEEVLQR